MNKKLNEEELSKLFSILKEYQNVFDELTNIEQEIDKLNTRQIELTNVLINNRKKEKEFTESIVKIYGKGKFNMETLEYQSDDIIINK